VKSLYNLGIIYYQGDLGIHDEEKYKQLIKRAAEKGDIQGKQQYIEIMLN
jgi:TPR repeat protein